MKPTFYLVAIFACSFHLSAQTSYAGFIDQYPIELVTNISTDGYVQAIYTYSNFDNPIIVMGKSVNGNLTLFEKDNYGKNKAMFLFEKFAPGNKVSAGRWTDLKTKKVLPVTLNKDFDMDDGEAFQWEDREILQPVSMGDKYFKLILSKSKDDMEAKVTGVKILEKKTDRLVQKIAVDCELLGLDNISTGDFNFDGITDFAVFETSYAGPNTSSVYFLYDPKTRNYFKSDFTGVSLEFDAKTKRVSEHNQCCAGRQHTTKKYKVVNNKMVLVEQHCFTWDEKKQKLVERKMSGCE